VSGLVIFDCDGVLVDTEVIACRVIAEVLTGAGFPVLEAEMRAFVGMSGPAAYQVIAERFGRSVPDHVQTEVRAQFRACMSDGLAPMPGVVELLDALTAPYCVGSNSSHPHLETALRAAGLAERFAGRVFSAADVARPKPHPDLFLHAAAHLAAEPARAVVIEDSVHGVAAGKAAGMRVLGFTGGGHCGADHALTLAAAGADAVCADMAEIARHMVDGGWARRA
jgi:HAD superfamily hydrolase (TIGR01509 family)